VTRIKEFAPKPTDVGGRLSYEEYVGGYRTERIGTVWAAGPAAASRWVVPDHEPDRIALVRVRTGKRTETISFCKLSDQRNVIRRCDAVYRAGGAFGVIDRMTWAGPGKQSPEVSWHVDRECSAASGKEPYAPTDRPATRQAHEIIRILLGETQSSFPDRLCPTCVYLLPTGDAR
jgi:hypothetical protein